MKTRQVLLLLHSRQDDDPQLGGVMVGPPRLTWSSGGEKPRPSKMLLVHCARRQLLAKAAIAASRQSPLHR